MDHRLRGVAVRFVRFADLTKADPVDRTEAGCVGVAGADEAVADTSRHRMVARLRLHRDLAFGLCLCDDIKTLFHVKLVQGYSYKIETK